MKPLISLKTPFLRTPMHARKQESRFERLGRNVCVFTQHPEVAR